MLAFKKTVHFLMFIVLIIISNDNIIKILSLSFLGNKMELAAARWLIWQREKMVVTLFKDCKYYV